MANWKKVIVSGSDAHLNNITGSGKLKFPSLDSTESLSLKPLVIDSNGVVYKGSGSISASYAISSSLAVSASYVKASNIDGANSVGFPYSGSQVLDTLGTPNAAVITGSLFVDAISASVNEAYAGGNITASGDIKALGNLIGQNANVTGVSSSGNISGAGDLKINNISASGNISGAGDLTINNITASGNIIGNKYYIASTGNRLAEKTNTAIRIGDPDLGLEFTSSKGFIISASGGVTMSNIPVDRQAPYVLALQDDQKDGFTPNVVKVPVSVLGGSGNDLTPQVNNDVISSFVTCSDNTNLSITTTTQNTSEQEILIGTVYVNDLGTDSNNYIASIEDVTSDTVTLPGNDQILIDQTAIAESYNQNPLQVGDTVRIKWFIKNPVNGQTDNADYREHTTTVASISVGNNGEVFKFPHYGNGWDEDNSRPSISSDPNDEFKVNATLQNSMSLAQGILTSQSLESGDLYEGLSVRSIPSYEIYKIVTQSSAQSVICLDEDLALNDVTQSGDLLFSGSTNHSHSIGFAVTASEAGGIVTSSYLTISASELYVQNKLKAHTLDATTYELAGFTFLDIGGVSITGSTDFGTSSLDTHKFTGSLFVSGTITANETNTIGFVGTSSRAVSASHAIIANTASYIKAANIDGANSVGFPYSGSDFIGSSDTPDKAVITGSLFITSSNNGSGSGNLEVVGHTNLKSISASSNVSILGDLDVDGIANLDAVDIDGAVDMALTLAVAGNVDFNGDLDVDGTTNLDAVDIDGAVDMALTLAVAGNVDFGGDLDVDGTTNLDIVDIDGAVDMASTLTVGSHITSSGNISASGYISASNFIGLFNTPEQTNITKLGVLTELDVNGDVTITGSLAFTSSAGATDNNITGLNSASLNYLIATNTVQAEHIHSTDDITAADDISAGGNISGAGNLTIHNITADGDVTVGGKLTVLGSQTTLHTENLTIEDRFLLIGSGSSIGANMDVGIIFDSGSIDGLGTALYYQNSTNRISIANKANNSILSANDPIKSNILDFTGQDTGTASFAGFVNTVRKVNFAGTLLTASINTSNVKEAQMGVGEMAVDNTGDIWIYTT